MQEKNILKNKIKRNKGITLIALVITVIVILILAGVCIATLTGDNGLLTQLDEAGNQTEIAKEKEIVQRAVTSAKIGNNGLIELLEENLQNELEKEVGEGNTKIDNLGETFEIQFLETKRYWQIDKDGNVEQLEFVRYKNSGNIAIGKDGETLLGTEESPYEIWCIEDLIEWSKKASTYANAYIKLGKNLDFKSDLSYLESDSTNYGDINADGEIQTIKEEMQTGKGFTPISTFGGTFDGQGYEIRNIYVNTTENAGLIANVSSATICNLGVTGEITKTVATTYSGAGGIIGKGVNSVIQNCYSKCNVTSANCSGGIIGFAGVNSTMKISNCYNLGNIDADPDSGLAGGIIGRNHGDACNPQVYNCYNIGAVKGAKAGGIIGVLNGWGVLLNCYNTGTVFGNEPGGIGGYVYTNVAIANCYNIGEIENTTEGGNTAGIYVSGAYFSTLDTDNLFCLIDSAKILTRYISIKQTDTKEYMQSQEFVDKLNEYVETYNAETEEDIILSTWRYNQGAYPTFE